MLTANESHSLSVDQSWTIESSGNDYHYSHWPPTLFPSRDSARGLNSPAKLAITTTKVSSNFKNSDSTTTTSFVSIDQRIPSVSSTMDLNEVTARYHSAGAVVAVAENATSKTVGSCLKQSLRDFLSRNRPDRTRHAVFERLPGKKRNALQRNEINERAKNADIPAKILPVANDFWRYAQFPTGEPLTISTTARPYRVQGLNGFRMNPRKSWKRAGLNSDGHTKATEVLRRLTKIKKSKEER